MDGDSNPRSEAWFRAITERVHTLSWPGSGKLDFVAFAARRLGLTLPVAPVTVPWLARVLRLPFAVLREGATNIDDLVEATLFVTPNIPFVGSGIDQFAFTRCHGRNLQLSLSACERASSWLGSRKDGSAAVSMIRWEQQDNGDWAGFSGELPVASVSKDQDAEPERWLWNIAGLKRPKGWRKPVGHRTTWLEARRSAEAYWEKWLTASSLRPDIERLALQSIPASERPKARRRKSSKG